MRSIWIRLISFLIIAATMITALAACTSNTTSDESGSESSSDSNESNSTEPIIDPEGILTIFANGAYNVRFIRHDTASAFEKNVYNSIKDLFKKRVGVAPSIADDFTPAGEEKYNGPAILIGETNYEESIAAYKNINEGEANATLVGNKYVISFTTQNSVDLLLDQLKTYLNKKASKTEIKADADWKINVKLKYYTSGNETFDENGVPKSASLPGNLGTSYNAGQGSTTYVRKNATKQTFDEACAAVEANGFKKYTTNKIGNNEFATYITQEQIVHFMYFHNNGELRTAVDKRGTGTNGFTLPGLSGDNSYPILEDSVMTLVDIENSCWPGGMCLIFKLCDGRFVVVDSGIGGNTNDGSSSGWVYASLAKHAKDPKNIQVAAWVITHVHSDHAGGLYDIAKGTYQTTLKKDNEQVRTHNVMPREASQWIKIDTIIYNQPNKLDNSSREGWMNTIINKFNVKKVIKAHPGQVFYFSDCKFTIYGSLDFVVDKTVTNTNDESLSMMFEFNGKKILILGDVFPLNIPYLATAYKEELKADVIQLIHHGYEHAYKSNDSNNSELIYQYVNPTIVLWPVAGYEKDQMNLANKPLNAIFKDVPSNMQFTPRGQNIDFDKNWNTKKYSLMSSIPYCDCTACKAGDAIKSSGN